jgi:TetR/AcrR family transcriptional repressor of bet genes
VTAPRRPAKPPTAERARFTRALPEVRRAEMMRAAAACLAEDGIGAATVRAVAARAGVTPGLVRHHFGGIDGLIAATYRHVGETVTEAIEAALAAAPADARGRLSAFVRASFAPPLLDGDLLATWLAFWGRVRRDAEIRSIHGEIYSAYRARVAAMLSAAAETGRPIDANRAALALTAVLDGLWLELCLDPSSFAADEAVRIVEAFVDALLAGALEGREQG